MLNSVAERTVAEAEAQPSCPPKMHWEPGPGHWTDNMVATQGTAEEEEKVPGAQKAFLPSGDHVKTPFK